MLFGIGKMCSPWNRVISRLSKNDFGMMSSPSRFVKASFFTFRWYSWWLKILHVFTWVQAEQGFYFVGKDLSGFLKTKFQELIGQEKAGPQEVEVVMGRTLQVFANLYSYKTYTQHSTQSYFKKSKILFVNCNRFHLVQMDVHIFPLMNYATDLLELQIILDCSVSLFNLVALI